MTSVWASQKIYALVFWNDLARLGWTAGYKKNFIASFPQAGCERRDSLFGAAAWLRIPEMIDETNFHEAKITDRPRNYLAREYERGGALLRGYRARGNTPLRDAH